MEIKNLQRFAVLCLAVISAILWVVSPAHGVLVLLAAIIGALHLIISEVIGD